MVVCAGNGEDFTFAKSIGVGLCESAMGLTQICLRECVDSILAMHKGCIHILVQCLINLINKKIINFFV